VNGQSQHSHTRAFVLIGIAIVALVIAIGVSFWLSLTPPVIPPSQRELYAAHFEEAMTSCYALADPAAQLSCREGYMSAKASVLLDDTVCDTINDSVNRKDCLDQVTLKIAIATNDLRSCDRNSDPQVCTDRYYNTLAKRQGTTDACASIKDEETRNSCYDQFSMKAAFRQGKCDLLRDPRQIEECTDIYHPGVKP
jgi:hypothetical protein